MNVRGVLIVGSLFVALAAGACASSGGPGKGANKSSSTTTAESAKTVAADKAIAQSASLRLSDFPAGWTAQPNPQDNTSAPQIEAQLASCLHTREAFFNTKSPAEVVSPSFTDPNGNDASSDITVESSATKVTKEFAVMQEPQLPNCMEQAFDRLISYELKHPSGSSDTVPKGVTVGKTTVAQMSFPSLGDRSIAFRMTMPITAEGLSTDIYFDIVAIQQGRVGTAIEFVGISSPFDSTMENQLTSLTAQRVTNSNVNA